MIRRKKGKKPNSLLLPFIIIIRSNFKIIFASRDLELHLCFVEPFATFFPLKTWHRVLSSAKQLFRFKAISMIRRKKETKLSSPALLLFVQISRSSSHRETSSFTFASSKHSLPFSPWKRNTEFYRVDPATRVLQPEREDLSVPKDRSR